MYRKLTRTKYSWMVISCFIYTTFSMVVCTILSYATGLFIMKQRKMYFMYFARRRFILHHKLIGFKCISTGSGDCVPRVERKQK